MLAITGSLWRREDDYLTLNGGPGRGHWSPRHRGTFTSVPDLIAAIRAFIDAYNQRCEPVRWTKTANRQKHSPTVHIAEHL